MTVYPYPPRRKHNYNAYRKFVLDAAAFMPPPARIAVEQYVHGLTNADIKALVDKNYSQFRPAHLEFQAIVSIECKLGKIFQKELAKLPGFGKKKAGMFHYGKSFVVMQWPYEAFHIINNPDEWRTSSLRTEAFGKRAKRIDKPLYNTQDMQVLREWVQSFYPTDAPTDLSVLANNLRKFPKGKAAGAPSATPASSPLGLVAENSR